MPAKAVEKKDTTTAPANAKAGRQRELDAAISSITKTYGEGAIMRLGDANAQQKIDVIPTGAAGWWKSTGPNPPARPR